MLSTATLTLSIRKMAIQGRSRIQGHQKAGFNDRFIANFLENVPLK